MEYSLSGLVKHLEDSLRDSVTRQKKTEDFIIELQDIIFKIRKIRDLQNHDEYLEKCPEDVKIDYDNKINGHLTEIIELFDLGDF